MSAVDGAALVAARGDEHKHTSVDSRITACEAGEGGDRVPAAGTDGAGSARQKGPRRGARVGLWVGGRDAIAIGAVGLGGGRSCDVVTTVSVEEFISERVSERWADNGSG